MKTRNTLAQRFDKWPDGESGITIIRAELDRLARQVRKLPVNQVTSWSQWATGYQSALDDVLALIREAKK